MITLPRIHIVTNDRVFSDDLFWPGLDALEGAIDVAVHVRSRNASARKILGFARDVTGHRLPLFMNDRVDIAVLTDAGGVHLPEDGLPVAQVRALCDSPVLIGKSTHSAYGAHRALDEGADYVFLGPIWPTESHGGTPGLGPPVLEELAGRKVIAIGGVDAERAAVCARAGAYGVAAISTFWHSPDPSGVIAELSLSFNDNG